MVVEPERSCAAGPGWVSPALSPGEAAEFSEYMASRGLGPCRVVSAEEGRRLKRNGLGRAGVLRGIQREAGEVARDRVPEVSAALDAAVRCVWISDDVVAALERASEAAKSAEAAIGALLARARRERDEEDGRA